MTVSGVWMWPQSIRDRGAERVVSYCVRSGITDIFFLVKGLAGTASHRSALAPNACERDLLRELIEAAHQKGIRIHAWFTSTCDESYKQLHPESGRCHYTRGKDRELISLADKGYLSYMESVVREVCRNYDVDGLHLDYIRYNHLLYGWAEEDLARYAAEGADTPHLRTLIERMFYHDPKQEACLFDAYRTGDESVIAFANARRKDVVRFASALTQCARAERSDLILSAALMPEGAYEDTAFSDLHYGQNYEDAARLYDFVLPMAYSKAYNQDGQWVRSVAEGTLKHGLKTVVGLHAYDGGTGLSLKEDIAALKNTPIHGICLFREGAFAMTYTEWKKLCLYNALNEPVTRIIAGNGTDAVILNEDVAPDEERRFALPFAPDTVQVFSGEKELCIHLTNDA